MLNEQQKIHFYILILLATASFNVCQNRSNPRFDLGIDSPIAPKELIDINPLAEYKIPYDFMKSFDFDVPHQVWVNYVKQRIGRSKAKES